MKHYERHTFVIDYCPETLAQRYRLLVGELALFQKAWPNAQVDYGANWVSISYSNRTNCYAMTLDAAEQFRDTVKRHDWWKEIL